MAHPKHKISSTRRDKRRTHYKAVVPTVVTCSNCGAAVLYHRVCPECGFYRGKLAIEKKAAESAAEKECIADNALFFRKINAPSERYGVGVSPSRTGFLQSGRGGARCVL